MSLARWKSLFFCAGLAICLLLPATGPAHAQSTASQSPSLTASVPPGESSSLQLAELALPANPAAVPAAPSPATQQYGGNNGWRSNVANHFALEFGGGFNAPAGDKDYITWGGQFTIGAGYNFSKRFALLAEYQFLDDKLPGKIIAEAGADGGNIHLWSFTLDPVVSLFPKSANDVYITGGGGFYRKVTNFTDIAYGTYCDYFFGCYGVSQSEVVGHFSSNQGGVNIGAGYQHRMGGMYGESKMKLFAEVRYIEAFTPAVLGQSANGLQPTTIEANTKVIPVSFGIRW